MKKLALFFLILPTLCSAQRVFTKDVHNFWIMRDSVMSTTDTAQQMRAIDRLYIAKASEGLKAFMLNKGNLGRQWLAFLKTTPSFWDSLQMKTPEIDRAAARLEKEIGRFQDLYPQLQPAQSYFLVGLRRQGGTIRGNLSILGVEVIMSGQAIEGDQLVRMGIHEYTHTQQKRPDFQKIDVLTSSIREGACDFVSQLVTGVPVKAAYMTYGPRHEKEIWDAFRKEMFTQKRDNWVSTGNNPALPAPDLGYFIGYQICKAYYGKIPDKKVALKTIIELDYADTAAVRYFLKIADYQGGK